MSFKFSWQDASVDYVDHRADHGQGQREIPDAVRDDYAAVGGGHIILHSYRGAYGPAFLGVVRSADPLSHRGCCGRLSALRIGARGSCGSCAEVDAGGVGYAISRGSCGWLRWGG